ncbi:MAG: vitamin K epoxide reductase family protein [Anaerolineales bacterium]
MTPRTQPSSRRLPHQPLYWISVAIALLGATDSLYLLILKWSGAASMCLGSGGCAAVNASPYSRLGTMPVSLIGLLGYLAIVGVHFLERRQRFFAENGPLMIFGMTLTGVIFSAYLTWVEFAIIGSFCPFCVASAILITINFVIAIIRLAKQFSS